MKKILILSLLLTSIYSFGQNNTATGTNAGGTGGTDNSSFGYFAGDVVSGTANTFVGSNSGKAVTTGTKNVFVGYYSGKSVTNSGNNTLIGSESGYLMTTGSANTFLGQGSGYQNTVGIGNVFLGYNAGYYETGSSKLYIDNSFTSIPLIYGDFSSNQIGINSLASGSYTLTVGGSINAMALYVNNLPIVPSQWTTSGSNLNFTSAGVVSIGTTQAPAGYKLAIGGKVIAEEVVVKLKENWGDYVFEPDYELLPLSELEKFIKTYKHLPGIPSAKEIERDGIKLSEINTALTKQVEELTLYIIELKKEVELLKKERN